MRPGLLWSGLLALSLLIPQPLRAERVIVRDAEIESYLRELAGPLMAAAGLDAEGVRLYVVRDPRINAGVAGGPNLFLNTGLLRATRSPEELAGVLAHELAHIQGGHLARLGRRIERARLQALLGALLGTAAAFAGAPEAAAALLLGGQSLAQEQLLRFTRTQESAADQAAVAILRDAGYPASGLVSFLEELDRRRFLAGLAEEVYLRTHPLTRERIRSLKARLAAQGAPQPSAFGPALRLRHQRVVAKLEGFLEDPQRVLNTRTGADFTDRYARAIALFRSGRGEGAAELLRTMLGENPEDPYLWELYGQVLFESGRGREALAPYRRAVALAPREPLIRLGLARVLVETASRSELEEARVLLQEVVAVDPDNAFAYRLLGIALGRLEDYGGSFLALTEWALLVHRVKDAELYLKRADAKLGADDPRRLRLEDLRREVERISPEQKRGR